MDTAMKTFISSPTVKPELLDVVRYCDWRSETVLYKRCYSITVSGSDGCWNYSIWVVCLFHSGWYKGFVIESDTSIKPKS